jgi:hypothetical protein
MDSDGRLGATDGRGGSYRRRLLAVTFSSLSVLALAWLPAPRTALAASGGTTVISFDDLPDGVPVSDQYATQGIVFSGAQAHDYSSSPGFAHSEPIAIVVPPVAEFCTTKSLEMRFPTPVTRVKIWYGLPERLGASDDLTLTGYDANDVEVGSVSQELVAGDGREPIDKPLELLDPLGPITTARIATGGSVPICDLAFDDVEFDHVPGPADLAIGQVQPLFTGTTMTLAIVVSNVGETASGSTSVIAQAAGWGAQTAVVDPIEPGAQAIVNLPFEIPATAVGSPAVFALVVDPKAAGDSNAQNNEATTTVTVPLPASLTPTESPTITILPATPAATAGDASSAGGSGPDLGLLLVVGGLAIAVTAGAIVLSRRPPGRPPPMPPRPPGPAIIVSPDKLVVQDADRSVVLTIDGQHVNLTAQDQEPPKRCRPGDLFCHREVSFDLRRRTLTSISAAWTGAQGSTELPVQLVKRTDDAVRRLARAASSEATAGVHAIAVEIAQTVYERVPRRSATATIHVAARVIGPNAQGNFTAYRCSPTGDGSSGTFEELAKATATVRDQLGWPLAELDVEVGTPGRDQLTQRIELNLLSLASQM